jgi:hypothetical protein
MFYARLCGWCFIGHRLELLLIVGGQHPRHGQQVHSTTSNKRFKHEPATTIIHLQPVLIVLNQQQYVSISKRPPSRSLHTLPSWPSYSFLSSLCHGCQRPRYNSRGRPTGWTSEREEHNSGGDQDKLDRQAGAGGFDNNRGWFLC